MNLDEMEIDRRGTWRLFGPEADQSGLIHGGQSLPVCAPAIVETFLKSNRTTNKLRQ